MAGNPFAKAPERNTDYLTLDEMGVTPALDGTCTGRLILFSPKKINCNIPGKAKPDGSPGTPYDAVAGDLVILDGPIAPKIPTVPFLVEDFRMSGGYLTNNIRGRFDLGTKVPGSKYEEYFLVPKDPETPMILSRLVKGKNQHGSVSWMFVNEGQPTDEEIAVGLAYLAAVPPKPKPNPFG